LGLLCRVGLHRWRRLDLATLTPNKDILHCFWCSRVKVDGVVYDTWRSIQTIPVPNFAKAGKLSILCDGLRRLNETKPHFPFSMSRPVAALSGGERPGDFRQPACGSRSGFIFFRQPAEPAALAAGTCFAGGASGFGQAAH